MICYLHIGTEKTGSSTIQKFLSLRRQGLRARGILYPVSPGDENQMKLATFAMSAGKMTDLQAQYGVSSADDVPAFRARFAKDLSEEISASKAKTCVMSGEHCSSRLIEDSEVERLRDLLFPLFSQVFVVVYLRRQDDYLLSSYSTDVKFGKREVCHIPTPDEAAARYTYDTLLDRWARVFGPSALIVRRYERRLLRKGDVLEDFLNIVAPGQTDGLERPPNENVSLDVETLEWLRQFNHYMPFLVDGQINPARGNIAILLEAISKGARFTLPAEDLAGFMERFRDSNRRVAELYFNGDLQPEGDPLFGPAPNRANSRPLQPLTAERSIEIAAKVWAMKHKQVLDLRQELRNATRRHERRQPSA